MSLLYITQQINIYISVFFLFTGIFGNGMNIWIFSSVRTYRTTPCTFFFLISSVCNGLYIIINLTIRIITAIYGIDLTTTSVIWCKIRSFLIGVLGVTSLTYSCWATIDQFFVTSRNIRLRRYSNIKWAYRSVFIVITVWFLNAIPILVFYNISPFTNMCENINVGYNMYLFLNSAGLLFIIPILIMVVFGYLTYRNIRLTRALVEQQANRQTIRMTSIQVVVVIVSMSPLGLFGIYNLITTGIDKNVNQRMIENLLFAIASLTFYFYYIGNFYMFFISSSRFRETVKDRILWWRKRNQVIPFQQSTRERTI